MSILLRRAMMGSGLIGGSSAFDPYFEQVVALLHAEGTNGGTSFVDSSNLALAYTASSATTSTVAYKFGVASGLVSTASSYVLSSVALPAIAASQNFTDEGWFNITTFASANIMLLRGNIAGAGYEIYTDVNGAVRVYGNSVEICATANSIVSTATWFHCALTRSAGVWRIWIDGVLRATSAIYPLAMSGQLQTGASTLYGLRGYFDEIRSTVGVARYTDTFTPPTAAFPDASAAKVYATLNPSEKAAQHTLSNGNLTLASSSSGGRSIATTYKNTGKWFYEVTVANVNVRLGWGTTSGNIGNNPGDEGGSFGWTSGGGVFSGGGVVTGTVSWTAGDVLGVALDYATGWIKLYKNGTLVLNDYNMFGATPTLRAPMGGADGAGTLGTFNFGATPFVYGPPAGYNAGYYETTQYATWNPSDKTGTQAVLTNQNLTFTATTSFELARATMGKTSGKWYWEVTVATSTDATVGVANTSQSITGDQWVGISANSWGWAQFNNFLYTNNTAGVYASSMNNGDVIGLALDMDSKTISYYQNGVFRGFQIGLTGTVHPAIGNFTSTAINATANFGATPFKHSVPPGYNPGIDNEPSISPAAQTYATWNPADKNAQVVLTTGNLTQVNNLGSIAVRATIGKTTGKWYWEVTRGQNGTGETSVGIGTASATLANWLGFDVNSVGYDSTIGSLYKNNAVVASGLGTYNTAGDTIGIALNQDNGTVLFYRNGVLVSTYTHGLSGAVFPMVGAVAGAQNEIANFGQYPFKYAVPAGFNSGVY